MDNQKQKTILRPAQLLLITGGARSGKSTFAQRMAERSGKSVAMVATAVASDDDMRKRIARHRAARPSSWQTIEEPLHIAQAVHVVATSADVVIIDCITTWLGNWLFMQDNENEIDEVLVDEQEHTAVLQEVDALLQVVAGLPEHKAVVMVTNEVGLGVVPAYALGRVYRDLLGTVNQKLARQATRVYLMVAGLAVDVKQLEQEANIW